MRADPSGAAKNQPGHDTPTGRIPHHHTVRNATAGQHHRQQSIRPGRHGLHMRARRFIHHQIPRRVRARDNRRGSCRSDRSPATAVAGVATGCIMRCTSTPTSASEPMNSKTPMPITAASSARDPCFSIMCFPFPNTVFSDRHMP